MSDFVTIDRSDVPVGRFDLSERNKALIAGETIWVAGSAKRWAANATTTLKTHGFRVRTRAMTRDGVEGYAAWAEKIEPRP